MRKQKILIVQPEQSAVNFLTTLLKVNGYEAITAKSGLNAYSMITSCCPNAVLLELELPDMDGMKVLRAVREWSSIPIIILSSRTHEQDKVEALDAGADDYITKPFGNSELLARIRTALRHGSMSNSKVQSGVFRAGGLIIDYDKRKAFIGGTDAGLTPNEYKIVALLSEHSGKVLTYDYIMKKLWGPVGGDNQILRVNMANIRRKIERDPSNPGLIFTEAGLGYRMAEGE